MGAGKGEEQKRRQFRVAAIEGKGALDDPEVETEEKLAAISVE